MSLTDLPEIVYLNGVRFVRTSEPQPGEEDQEALIRTLTSSEPILSCRNTGAVTDFIPVFRSPLPQAPDVDPVSDGPVFPDWIETHPISVEKARELGRAVYETWPPMAMARHRRDWWCLLRAARTPDERLTCERMINVFGEAIGRYQARRGY